MRFLVVLLNDDGADFALVEGGVVNVVLGRDPPDVHVGWVLPGEDSNAEEVLIDELEALRVHRLPARRLFAGLQPKGSLVRPIRWLAGRQRGRNLREGKTQRGAEPRATRITFNGDLDPFVGPKACVPRGALTGCFQGYWESPLK